MPHWLSETLALIHHPSSGSCKIWAVRWVGKLLSRICRWLSYSVSASWKKRAGYIVSASWKKRAALPATERITALRFKLIRSWIFRQHLGKYAGQSSSVRNWEIDILVCSLCAEAKGRAGGSVHVPGNRCFSTCCTSVGLGNPGPTGCHCWVIWIYVPRMAFSKVRALDMWSKSFSPQGESRSWGFPND